MKYLLLSLGLALAAPSRLLAQAPGFARTPSGIEYRLYRRDASGHYQPRPLAVPGDSAYSTREGRSLLAHLTYLTGRDSVLQSTRQQFDNHPVPLPLGSIARPGRQEEALSLLLPGDSAVFRFSIDSLYVDMPQPVPAFLRRAGNVLVIQVAAVRLLSASATLAESAQLQQVALAQQRKQAQAYARAHGAEENAAIVAYLQRNKLLASAKELPGGTWYVITQRGAGALPKEGQLVTVSYRGTLLATGREFDSSTKRPGQPFTFALGRGQVIPGWDEALAVLPKGSKAILLIPSTQAYGDRGSPPSIPPRASLRFDIAVPGAPARALPRRPAASVKHTKSKR